MTGRTDIEARSKRAATKSFLRKPEDGSSPGYSTFLRRAFSVTEVFQTLSPES
jgi:hypothetical protein